MIAKCPNGCDADFHVNLEVTYLEHLIVSETGKIEDAVSSSVVSDRDPFATEWFCCICNEEPIFMEDDKKDNI